LIGTWKGEEEDSNVGIDLEIMSFFKGAQNFLIIKYEQK